MCWKVLFVASAVVVLSGTLIVNGDPYGREEEEIGQRNREDKCSQIPPEEKLDCLPIGPVDEKTCVDRKCCWSPSLNDEPFQGIGPRIGVPRCYYPPNYTGYSSSAPVEVRTGFQVNMTRKIKSLFSKDVETVMMDFRLETPTRLHVKLTDVKQRRFTPPYPIVPGLFDRLPNSLDYDVQVKQGSCGFNVVRKKTNQTIFKALDVGDLVYSDQFLEISAILPKGTSIYGLGEHQGPLKINNDQNYKVITMFNRDRVPEQNKNLYGSHPFYLAVEPSGNSHGFFLLNSNAMDFIISPNPTITIRTIGGILDMYFFLGPTPADVISQYGKVVGTPPLPPYWSLGFHLCKFIYGSLNRTQEIWQKNRDAGIPFDVQWNDIDYMENYNDFTYNNVTYAGLPDFVKKLHEAGMKWVPSIDPGVSASEPPGTYPPLDEGIKQDIFVKDEKNQTFIGKVWNTVSTAFPDFTHPKAQAYWTNMLKMFHDKVPFDGIWLDMNEPSNFLSGSTKGCPDNSLEKPQYVPQVDGGVLKTMTLCMSAKHYIGNHYDVHNLYGFMEAIVTDFALRKILNKRSFIISRSSFAGHGRYASHWTGDVASSWEDMRMSIPQMLSFNMFQIPLVGADICGFNGNTTKSLCLRWSQLGAFYPFARNHNDASAIDQDPVSMGPEVTKAAKDALTLRYTLLPYLYTLFFKAHHGGDTVARPVFFEFHQDPKTLAIDEQFLWGKWLLIAPVLREGATDVKLYLPKGVWYKFPRGQKIESNGTEVTLDAPTTTIPLLVRGGGILPLQQANVTTTLSRLNPFEILVAPDSDNKAEGELYWDDGDSLISLEQGKYVLYKYTFEKNVIKGQVMHKGYDGPPVKYFTIYGVASKPKQISFNNQSITEYEYNEATKVLKITHEADPSKPCTLGWS